MTAAFITVFQLPMRKSTEAYCIPFCSKVLMTYIPCEMAYAMGMYCRAEQTQRRISVNMASRPK